MANIDDDNGVNDSNNEAFRDVLEARLSRRLFMGSGVAAAAGLTLGGTAA